MKKLWNMTNVKMAAVMAKAGCILRDRRGEGYIDTVVFS